jgi:hypothetical protein
MLPGEDRAVELNDVCAYDYARMLERKAGTPPAEERGLLQSSLCARCEHGVVYRRQDHLDVTAYCKTMLCPVPPDVAECTTFQRPNTLDLEHMVEMAVAIDVRDGVNGRAYL